MFKHEKHTPTQEILSRGLRASCKRIALGAAMRGCVCALCAARIMDFVPYPIKCIRQFDSGLQFAAVRNSTTVQFHIYPVTATSVKMSSFWLIRKATAICRLRRRAALMILLTFLSKFCLFDYTFRQYLLMEQKSQNILKLSQDVKVVLLTSSIIIPIVVYHKYISRVC